MLLYIKQQPQRKVLARMEIKEAQAFKQLN
jgi:hypothetical protein